MKTVSSILAISLGAITFTVTQSPASPITPGNLVIYRVGDGAAALGTTAAAVFLDEYTPLGTFVQSLDVATLGGAAFSAVGNATTEGIISPSQDGLSLVFTGYRKAPGGTSPASDTYLVTSRVIGTVNAAGTINTTTTLTSDGGATTANTIRSATTVDGTAFWTSTSSRIGYDATPNTPGGTTQIDARNSRQVNISGNKLFASNGSTAITGKVQDYGILPVGATAPNPDVVLATTDAVNGFALFDLSPGVPGVDTIYALSTVGSQLIKWTYNGTTWSASGSLSSSASNLTGYSDASGVHLFLTSGTTLSTELDTSGYGGTINGTITGIATAGANTAFRGIGMFPGVIPEPSTCTLGLLGLAGILALRRRLS